MLFVQMKTCGWDVAQALNVFFSGPSVSYPSIERPENDHQVDHAINITPPKSDTANASFSDLNITQDFVNDDASETDEVLKAAIRASLNDEASSRICTQGGELPPVRKEAPSTKFEPKAILRGSFGNEPNPISRLRSAPTHDKRNTESSKHRRMSLENLDSRNSRVEEEKILADRFLRYDQDEEYELSLAQDRAKDEQRRFAELQKRLLDPCDALDLFKLNLSVTN
jgi:hypothetical protein